MKRQCPSPLYRFSWLFSLGLLLVMVPPAPPASAQVGSLLFEENFDTLDTNRWTVDIGDGCDQGLCGWGNQELQSYGANNVRIEAVPGEPGNSALVLEARDEAVGGLAFTSGKVQSKDKIAIQYGMVEIRMRVPNLDTGLWPAAWLLGTSTATWPAKGEIDIMEMGHAFASKDRQGYGSTPINNYVGSNLIFYSADACVPENPTCAASSSWDVTYNTPYASGTPMNDRFVTYRLYWTDTEIQFSVIDGGTEHFLHATPFQIGGEADEFQAPFYFLLNLAVGGNFTDAATNAQVSAPRPAKMYVDYLRVYQYNGQGQVFTGNVTPPETGTFGVFTDTTPVDNELVAGVSSDIWVWDPTTSAGTTPPFEGSEVIAWNVQAGGWFGGGIQTRQARDMSNFTDGNLRFRIRIPAEVTFRIGITDTYTNENWLTFPANTTTYGLVRDGQWGEAVIPVSDLRGSLIALQSLSYLFAIAADPPASSFQMAIDDIYWEGGGASDPDSDGDGVPDSADQCPGTPSGTAVDAVGCPLPVAEDVRVEAEDYVAYSDSDIGNNGGAYRSDDVDIEAASGGGYNVGWTVAGEWLEYTVSLGAGTYDVSARVASDTGGGAYTVSLDGNTIGSDTVGATGGWQVWETHAVGTVTVGSSGDHTLRVDITGANLNLDWLDLLVASGPVDSDGDGVDDGADQCPGTPSGTPVDAVGCPVQSSLTGVNMTGATSIEFFVNTPDWADVHYSINGGLQQNVRMVQAGGTNTYTVNGLSSGDGVSYYFTYWDRAGGFAVVTSVETYTHSGGPTDSDGDGVDDGTDQCPGTPSGTPVDSVGCPLPAAQDVHVEAEDYTAYADSDAGNTGGVYRTDDVDIEATTDAGGGYNVGWTVAGEWLEYAISVNAGTYTVSTRVASETGGGAYTVSLDGSTIGSDTVGATGGWQAWETHTVGTVTVSSSGTHTLRLDVTGPNFNLNWIELTVGAPSGDSDGDGVADANDQCPGTPSGTAVDAVGCPLPQDTDGDGVADADDLCPGTPSGTSVDANGCPISSGSIVALYDASTALEPPTQFETADALVTRFTDRARDRHGKENHYQSYDHYLSFYWEFRTAQIEIIDRVAKGGTGIRMNVTIDHPLDDLEAENRWFYIGNNTLAEYCGNGGMAERTDVVSPDPNLYYYFKELSLNCRNNFAPIAIGDKLEFEVSQFLGLAGGGGQLLSGRGRANYYGTTFLYIVGEGIVPWEGSDHVPFVGGNTFQRDSVKIPESAWLGGHTTIHAHETAEPDNHFMQMATNLGYDNGQPFVDGRRLIHTSFVDGDHVDESPDNEDFFAMAGKAGTHFIAESCVTCHVRNGRAAPADPGVDLVQWVFKLGDGSGNADPARGFVLQPSHTPGAVGEGTVNIASWSEQNGLRSPNFAFSTGTPARFSARIAPQLVGMGLLEAIPESTVLALADENDTNGDGISGKAQRVTDPVTGQTRLGRFGWKAATSSVRHQVAAALNTDIGVMTSVLPNPDCGSSQGDCGSSGSELADSDLDDMVKYISLLGVRPQRDHGDPEVIAGKAVFAQIGCNDCHVETLQTSPYHPFAELRSQTIHPYTDLLLHDMGPGLADNLGEGDATGAEWRTPALWGLGLTACVTGGVTGTPGGSAFGVDGNETCTPEHSYLHDGRARSIEEAILWHGGEGESSKQGYQALSATDRNALLRFLGSL